MINFVIFVLFALLIEVLLLLIFGPNLFDYFFMSILILIIGIPCILVVLALTIAAIQNPIITLNILLVLYIFIRFLLFL
jgi:hypothetical protein